MKNLFVIICICMQYANVFGQDVISEIPIGSLLQKQDPMMILPDFVFHVGKLISTPETEDLSVHITDISITGLSSLVIKMYSTPSADVKVQIIAKNLNLVINHCQIYLDKTLSAQTTVIVGFENFNLELIASENERVTVKSVDFPINDFKISTPQYKSLGDLITLFVKSTFNKIEPYIRPIVEIGMNVVFYFVKTTP